MYFYENSNTIHVSKTQALEFRYLACDIVQYMSSKIVQIAIQRQKEAPTRVIIRHLCMKRLIINLLRSLIVQS